MKTLVVHCHPNPDSFNAALYRAAVGALRTAGHELRCIDLYAEGFDPVLTREELVAIGEVCRKAAVEDVVILRCKLAQIDAGGSAIALAALGRIGGTGRRVGAGARSALGGGGLGGAGGAAAWYRRGSRAW